LRRNGIKLAGGSGTRLHPITQVVSKQLLPVHEKPMIDDPLTTSPVQPAFERLLGDGAAWGMTIRYPLQPSPDVLAQTFLIGAEFLAGAPAALVLGDNLFHGYHQMPQLEASHGPAAGASRFTSDTEMVLFRATADLDFLLLKHEAFAGCTSVAIDVAVMDKTERDIHEDARKCYLRSEHCLVVDLLEKEGAPESKAHRRICRPWGSYDGVTEGERWQIKEIAVNPGASLSLQMHHNRAEHWIVAQGTALVEKNGSRSWWVRTRAPTSPWAAGTASRTQARSRRR